MRFVLRLLVLSLVSLALGAGCDLAPRTTTDPAREQWEALAPKLKERVSLLRNRQTVLGGRVAALTVPPGVQDPALAQQISELQAKLSELDAAITGFEDAVTQVSGEIETAFGRRDKVAARRLVDLAAARVDEAHATASAPFDAIEQRLPQAEAATSRHLAMVAAEEQRLVRVASEGGDLAAPVKWQGKVIDLADGSTKATFDRLVKLGSACDQIRLRVVARDEDHADDVAKKMVMAGVPAERVEADDDAQLPAEMIKVTVTAPCQPAVPAAAAGGAPPPPPSG
ncbi:MAG: hypothetical protein K8M05_14990, partial [Deltaproteobacteria bacterium]|nr:hypothetical protein [Kofleriaceae bacterium]